MAPNDAAAHSIASGSLDDVCQGAMGLQLAGKLELAEQSYRAILEREPRHATANYCLGMLQVQLRRPVQALSYLMAALQASPSVPDYWLGYLEALLLAGSTEEARQTLALARQHGLAGKAAEDFAARLSLKLSAPTALTTPAAGSDRLVRRAEQALLRALKAGKLSVAEARSRDLIQRFPERGLGFKTLGVLLWSQRHFEQAAEAMQNAIARLPDDAEAHANLGETLNKLERFDEAERVLRRAIELDPTCADAHARLADACQATGRYAEAEASIRSSIAFGSEQHRGDLRHTSFLFLLSHNPEIDADALFAEHLRIGSLLESGVRASERRHSNTADPDRRLRIGFVSADLYRHPVTNFFEPILALMSRRADLELFAYYNNAKEDSCTQRLRGYMHQWNAVAGVSDAQLARNIKQDRIDILVDLSSHTSMNRLRMFAAKPAPIQLTWLGYPGTTGLRAMDYYVADRASLPPGEFDGQFTEKLVYLPAAAPFHPDPAAPPIAALPALRNGHITFGSFNRMGKLNAATIGFWSRLLRAVPDSMMLLVGIPPATLQSERVIEWFAAQGVVAERLRFHPHAKMEVYLALHGEVDICLDTFPYSGGTTTYHALWMGVPTLTIAGRTPASRQGSAIFEHLDLREFVAADAADFLAKGVHWTRHLPALAALRASLRERALNSSVCDPHVFAETFIRALRHMWIRWCDALPPESFEINVPQSIGAAHGRQ
jgi:predicted O-linked N-acetylglucosamine transferase (SPINDLY family)